MRRAQSLCPPPNLIARCHTLGIFWPAESGGWRDTKSTSQAAMPAIALSAPSQASHWLDIRTGLHGQKRCRCGCPLPKAPPPLSSFSLALASALLRMRLLCARGTSARLGLAGDDGAAIAHAQTEQSAISASSAQPGSYRPRRALISPAIGLIGATIEKHSNSSQRLLPTLSCQQAPSIGSTRMASAAGSDYAISMKHHLKAQ
ncbi:hypothetical protein IWW48_006363, partial [Coemansia sp. RSA 1200]